MKSFELKGEKRNEISKKNTKELRDSGKVPCVLYGGRENIHFSLDMIPVEKIIYTPNVYLLNIDIEGTKHNAVVQEMQFHPVSDKVIHIDFVVADESKPVIVSLPVNFTGISVGVDKGGKLNTSKRYLKVKGIASQLPDKIDIDITKLEIGDNIKVADMNPENYEIIDSKSALIVSVINSRAAIKAATEGSEEEAEKAEA